MASVPVTITGVLADKYGRTIQAVTLFGEMVRSDVGVGGGPIVPPPNGGNGKPPQIWGPTDPRPSNPISGIPGLPGYEPGKPPGGDHIWGPTDPRPTPPIYLPPIVPGGPPIDIGAHPEHPIVLPPPPDITPPPPDVAVKAPPETGGWGYVSAWGWGYFPKSGSPGPK